MKNSLITILLWMIFYSLRATAQVPVREEPRHHPVLQNKYFRLLDVWLPPGDTTLFHIHATPSLFVILSNTITAAQIKDSAWSTAGRSKAGTTWYRSFTPDTLIHRVCNSDNIVFHVNDIELLSPYNSAASNKKRLPFPVEFENEKATTYRLTGPDFKNQIIHNRGPMIAELVTGTGIELHDNAKKQTTKIVAGKYVYIAPGTDFYFSATEKNNVEMVLFEIK